MITDPADFPKMAQYLAFSWDVEALAKFDLNVVRGCTADGAVKDSYAATPRQVNLIMPGRVTPTNPCSNELGFSATYGNGYWAHTAPLASPYPGIGTIRPASEADKARRPDGSIFLQPVHNHLVLNMHSSGDDEKTAEWAARLKAHWALENVGGSFAAKPWLHGVFTDNHLYWHAYDSHLGGVGATWDDGLVRNGFKLRELLGQDVVLGGNGAMYPCVGIHDEQYFGTIPNGSCASANAAMYEEGANKIYWDLAWDHFAERLPQWIAKKSLDGRDRFGIFAVYGNVVATGRGRPITDADKRLALAMATIGGWHLWITQDSSWSTTIVPGGPNSIPEMGQSSQFPRGWLGQPTALPSRVGFGRWKRIFTGGTVYANTTTSPWTVDGLTVLPDDALFSKVTVPPPPPGPTAKDLVTASIAEHRLNRFYYVRWQNDNPVESAKVIAYLDGGPRPMNADVPTHYGKGLVFAEDARRKL